MDLLTSDVRAGIVVVTWVVVGGVEVVIKVVCGIVVTGVSVSVTVVAGVVVGGVEVTGVVTVILVEVVGGLMEGFEVKMIMGIGSGMRVTTGVGSRGMGMNMGVSVNVGVAIGVLNVKIWGPIVVNVPIWVVLGRNVVCKLVNEVIIPISGFARKIS